MLLYKSRSPHPNTSQASFPSPRKKCQRPANLTILAVLDTHDALRFVLMVAYTLAFWALQDAAPIVVLTVELAYLGRDQCRR